MHSIANAYAANLIVRKVDEERLVFVVTSAYNGILDEPAVFSTRPAAERYYDHLRTEAMNLSVDNLTDDLWDAFEENCGIEISMWDVIVDERDEAANRKETIE